MIVNMVKQFASDKIREVYRQCDENEGISDIVVIYIIGMEDN